VAEDLDRAYVINGDDLRIELGRRVFDFTDQGCTASGKLADPEDSARYILKRIAKPLEDKQPAAIPGHKHTGQTSACTCPWPEPAPAQDERDAELAAMEVIVDAFDALDSAEIGRILRWAVDRYAAEVS